VTVIARGSEREREVLQALLVLQLLGSLAAIALSTGTRQVEMG